MLIHLKNASLKLNQRLLLENISLELRTGDVLQIRGANGSGKSTFLKLLAGQHWQTSGSRTYHFTVPRTTPIGASIALVSPEMQERYQRLEHDCTVLQVLQTGYAQTDFLYAPLEPKQQQHLLELATQLKLTALLEQPFNTLSKGQMRQVLLARALLFKPKLLLLDEFFSGLDARSRQRLRQIVLYYLEQGGTLVYTTHREEQSFGVGERLLTLEEGREKSEEKTVGSNPQTVGARRASPTLPRTQIVQSTPPEILIEIKHANVYLGQPKDDATAADGHGSSQYHLILKDINFCLKRGQHWLITGHNGAGKSTFAKLLRGDVAPAIGGLVHHFGSSRTPIWQRHAKIALVSSDLQAWHRVDATGFEIVASGFSGGIGWHGQLEPAQTARVEFLLLRFEITFLASRNALYASQGELRKLLLARALVTQPEVIILDEAFDYLDAGSRNLVWRVLEQSGATLLVIAHREEDKPPFATRCLEVKRGKVKMKL